MTRATPHPIVARLAARRRVRRIPQTVMARRLRVSKATFANWEQGRHEPHLHLLTAWAELLGMRLDVVAEQAPAHQLELLREAS